MTLIQDSLWLVCDTETTGEDPKIHSPVEIAVVLTDLAHNLVSVDSLVNPGHKITSGAKAVHHILDDQVKGFPNLHTVLKDTIAPVLSDYTLTGYAAHKADFDSAMLPMLCKRPWLCTLRFAKKILPKEITHFSNQFLRYELELQVPEAEGLTPHRAMADALVTAALLRHLLALAILDPLWPDDVEGLLDRINAPFLIDICPFKKHKDKHFSQVVNEDRQYLEWLLAPKADQKPLDADMAYSIRHWLKQGRS